MKIKSIKAFDSFNNSITMTSFLEQLFLCFKMICKQSILVGLHTISIFDSVVFILGILSMYVPPAPSVELQTNSLCSLPPDVKLNARAWLN